MDQSETNGRRLCVPWNKGKLVGQKSPLRLKEIWARRSESARSTSSFPTWTRIGGGKRSVGPVQLSKPARRHVDSSAGLISLTPLPEADQNGRKRFTEGR